MSYEGKHLCYAELNQRANRLAARLRAMGARPGTFVCLLVERSLEAITGLLGILKSGAAYVPLDTTHPQSRLSFMLEDARPIAIATQSFLVEGLPAGAAPAGSLKKWAGSLSQGAISVSGLDDYHVGMQGEAARAALTDRLSVCVSQARDEAEREPRARSVEGLPRMVLLQGPQHQQRSCTEQRAQRQGGPPRDQDQRDGSPARVPCDQTDAKQPPRRYMRRRNRESEARGADDQRGGRQVRDQPLPEFQGGDLVRHGLGHPARVEQPAERHGQP